MSKLIKFIFLVIGIFVASKGYCPGQSFKDENWFLRNIHTPRNIKPVSKKKKIVIAIVDDGIRITHQDLQRFIWKNPKEIPGNNIDDDGNGYVDDTHGWDVADNNNTVIPPQNRHQEFYHGTHLAGIVAQIAQSAYGDSSLNFIQIMPVKCLADRATTTYLKDSYKGIEYAIQAGSDIIICAWGMAFISPAESKILQEAHEKGILIVASAGNFPEGREQYPAAHESVLAVTALNQEDKKVSNSNFGHFVDLSAPGENIVSISVKSDTDYEEREGTSQSAAMVAAAAALVKLQHPSYSWERVKACLKSSADAIDQINPQYSAKLGAGKLNIEGALECGTFSQKTKDENQLINPQGYLYFYHPKGKSAAWIIKPHGTFKGLRFKPLSIKGKTGKSSLNFYADHSPGSELLGSYSFTDLPDSIYVPRTTAYVTFEPKGAGNQLEWLMEYRAEPIDFSKLYCQGTKYLDVEGTFEDGSGPNNYSPNSDCKWLITAPKNKVIHIKFTEFDTEGKTDLLYFFNGAGTHEPIMAIFSGPDIPPELTTWGNQVLVWFITDGANQGKGWKAVYQFQDR
jgi:hypothetical protein